MRRKLRRIPRNYEGKLPTGRSLQELLPSLLEQFGELHKERPDLVVQAWPEIIGEKIAPMTQAVSFKKGFLHIRVNNSTLLSLLVNYEKKRLLELLRKKFPSTEIHDIVFRIG
ncbi:MAG: hypothetical protein Tsb0015_08890 [Simkaniaceae bacterium]